MNTGLNTPNIQKLTSDLPPVKWFVGPICWVVF